MYVLIYVIIREYFSLKALSHRTYNKKAIPSEWLSFRPARNLLLNKDYLSLVSIRIYPRERDRSLTRHYVLTV